MTPEMDETWKRSKCRLCGQRIGAPTAEANVRMMEEHLRIYHPDEFREYLTELRNL
jgi:hypothetical protein